MDESRLSLFLADLEAQKVATGGFRHFFRHAYGAEIDYAQLRSNLDKAEQLKPMLFQNLAQFIQTIRD